MSSKQKNQEKQKTEEKRRPDTATLEKPLLLDPNRLLNMTRISRSRLMEIENLILSSNNNKVISNEMKKKLGVEDIISNNPKIKISSPITDPPPPCMSCGRPDLPERFHSHPQNRRTSAIAVSPEKNPNVSSPTPILSTRHEKRTTLAHGVTKPIAVKFKSTKHQPQSLPKISKSDTEQSNNKVTSNFSEIHRHIKHNSTTTKKKSPNVSNISSSKTYHNPNNIKTDVEEICNPLSTTYCYVCGRTFNLPITELEDHEKECLAKWHKENEELPEKEKRSEPFKLDDKVNEQFYQQHLTQLVACSKCQRRFNPDRIHKHQKSCLGPIQK